MTTPGLHPALEPADTLDWPRLEALLTLRLVEDERLDYKDRVVASVMETAAAMANTRGGTIIIGVREDPAVPNTPGTWEGVPGDPQGALNNINWSYCTPTVRMRLIPLVNPTTGHTVLVAAVEPALQPPHWHRDKGNQIRIGDQNRLAPPELLETWYSAKTAGHPSENALRARGATAAQYGAPGFSMHVWPFAVVPLSRFAPETDVELDRLGSILLPAGSWDGQPRGSEYVLQADRVDRHSVAAVAEQAYARFLHIAVLETPAASVDLVVSLYDLVLQYGRLLAFAEIGLTSACDAPPPFRVELLIHYGSSWRVDPPPTSLEFTDPALPGNAAIETPAIVTATLHRGRADEATKELLTGTLRRLGWRNFDSVVNHVTSDLTSAMQTLYESA